MDAAGRRFGVAATVSESEARRVQAEVLGGIAEEDLAPSYTGLPEGLSAERLETELGGLDGAGFRALEDEIAGRLDVLPLYRQAGSGVAAARSRELPCM